jgi:hypothetical protein
MQERGETMDSDLLKRREALIGRHNAAMERWPQRSGTAFQTELAQVAIALEAVARETADRDGNELEISRTWRWAGMAWYDLARSREPEWLHRACSTYRQAAAYLDAETDPVDASKLEYCYGRALLSLSNQTDPDVAGEAVERLARSRVLARQSAPGLLPSIEEALRNAERVAALRGQVDRLEDQAAALTDQLMPSSGATGQAAPVPGAGDNFEPLASFQLLSQVFEEEKGKGTMTPERKDALDQIMGELGRLVGKSGTDRSLMSQDGQALEELMQRMKPLLEPADD